MKHYCGIDLHSTNSVVAMIDEKGATVWRRRFPNDLSLIVKALTTSSESLVGTVVESTFNWYWLVDGLMDAGLKVHLANPAAIQQYDGLKHTDDDTDAVWLAEMLRLGILPEGYIYPKEERPVRDLLRKRSQLVRQRTMNILSIQNLMARNTGRGISGKELRKVGDGFWEEVFPCAENVLAVKSNQFVLEHINEQIQLIEKAVLERARVKKEYQVLISTCGIGKVLALTIMLETGDIGRFPRVGNYTSYCRCVSSEKISNGRRKGSGNTKCGNKYLGWAYIEAANFVIRHNPIVKSYYQRKMAKTKRVIALKTVAHKLARAFYHMLRDQVSFQAERAFA